MGRKKLEKKGKGTYIYLRDPKTWEIFKEYCESIGSKPSRVLEDFMFRQTVRFKVVQEMNKKKGDEN